MARSAVESPQVDRPIFIVAPHRSGTTLLYRILAKHPDVGFYNQANRRWRSTPRLAHLRTRVWSRNDGPVEAQRLWDRYWPGRDDVMTAEDATPEAVGWYRRSVARVLTLRGASRFLAKYPRLSLRLDWLDAVFPDCLFVHIVRDWRAVVNSTLGRRAQRQAGSGLWYGMRIPGWREMAQLAPELVAGRQYRITTQAIEARTERYSERLLRVHYEELCRDPEKTIRRIADHCELAWPAEFAGTLPRELTSANVRWRRELASEKIERVRAEDPAFYSAHEEPE